MKAKGEAHKTQMELKLKVKELSARVEGYEKVENELDQVVLQAAEGRVWLTIE